MEAGEEDNNPLPLEEAGDSPLDEQLLGQLLARPKKVAMEIMTTSATLARTWKATVLWISDEELEWFTAAVPL